MCECVKFTRVCMHIYICMACCVCGEHSGLDADLARKFILHTHKYINECIEHMSPTHKGRGLVGNLT